MFILKFVIQVLVMVIRQVGRLIMRILYPLRHPFRFMGLVILALIGVVVLPHLEQIQAGVSQVSDLMTQAKELWP